MATKNLVMILIGSILILISILIATPLNIEVDKFVAVCPGSMGLILLGVGIHNARYTKSRNDVHYQIRKLKDRDAATRGNAAYILGTLKNSHAVEPLVAALNDESDAVQAVAAEALRRIGGLDTKQEQALRQWKLKDKPILPAFSTTKTSSRTNDLFLLACILFAGLGFLGLVTNRGGDPVNRIGWIVLLAPLVLFIVVRGANEKKTSQNLTFSIFLKLLIGSIFAIGFVGYMVYLVTYKMTCVARIRPGANLAYCNFQDRDLKRADFTGSNLEGAYLGGADLTGAILTGANLDHTNLENARGLTDTYLAEALNIPIESLSNMLSKKEIRLESREAILGELKKVCRGQGVPGGHEYVANEDFHPVMLFNAQGNRHEWTDLTMGGGVEPMALRFSELVACIEEEKASEYYTCSYTDGSRITLYQHYVQIKLYTVKTGILVSETTISGAIPTCPELKNAGANSSVTGPSVSFYNTMAWLREFVHHP